MATLRDGLALPHWSPSCEIDSTLGWDYLNGDGGGRFDAETLEEFNASWRLLETFPIVDGYEDTSTWDMCMIAFRMHITVH